MKEFRYVEPPSTDKTVDENGLTVAQIDFDETRDLKIVVRETKRAR